jgi:heme-degrading monooxygenase HmoA
MPPIPWAAAAAATAADDEVVVMASLLQLDSFRHVPGFLRVAMAIRQQVLDAEGAVGVALDTALPKRTFFTLSAWRDRGALNDFVRSEPHAGAMRRYRRAMADARFVFWSVDPDKLPRAWPEARQRLRDATPISRPVVGEGHE